MISKYTHMWDLMAQARWFTSLELWWLPSSAVHFLFSQVPCLHVHTNLRCSPGSRWVIPLSKPSQWTGLPHFYQVVNCTAQKLVGEQMNAFVMREEWPAEVTFFIPAVLTYAWGPTEDSIALQSSVDCLQQNLVSQRPYTAQIRAYKLAFNFTFAQSFPQHRNE